jgi:hypothetical protein
VAGFDDVICDDFVEDAHRFREGVVVVAKGEEEGFYCSKARGGVSQCAMGTK